MDDWKEQVLFSCECCSPEHDLRFTLVKSEYTKTGWWEPELYATMYLGTWLPWYRRLWKAIKYTFGVHTCGYGHFDEALLGRSNANRFLELATKFHNEVQKYNEGVEEELKKKE